MSEERLLQFFRPDGSEAARARLVGRKAGTITCLTSAEAASYGEEPLQILEGESYQFELDTPDLHVEESAVIRRFLVGSEEIDRGEISPGLNTGLLRIHLRNNSGRIATAKLEVRSAKLGYRDEYRFMLERISQASLDLLARLPEASQIRLKVDETSSVESLQQQFFFLRGILEGDEFVSAIAQIVRQPHSRLIPKEEVRPLSKSIKPTGDLGRILAGHGTRLRVPAAHPLAAKLSNGGARQPSLPAEIRHSENEDTLDTQENRFLKFVLEEFLSVTEQIETRLEAAGGSASLFAERELRPQREKLEEIMRHDFFTEVKAATQIAVASPVLQRKAGYRDILSAWLRFQCTSRLVWAGGEEVFEGGQRDIATLYEYWLFFVLWDVIAKRFSGDADKLITSRIFEKSTDGFGLKLKSGEYLPVDGLEIQHGGASLKMQFSYNRTFRSAPMTDLKLRLPYSGNYPEAGTWTKPMRPDFTLSFWPSDLTAENAEIDGRMVHIHLDAKYRVEFLKEVFGGDDEDLQEEKWLQREGRFKRADLIKMHAYKDAIRRTQGAYVLYPGRSEAMPNGSIWRKYEELIPGLGAFAVRPAAEAEGMATLDAFISDILDNVAKNAKATHP